MPDPGGPSPLSEILGDPDRPSPLRQSFLRTAESLFGGRGGDRPALLAGGGHAGQVQVPVKGTYAAITKNGQGLLLAADIQMSGLGPHAELREIGPLEFELVGHTFLPNLMNLCIVSAPPVSFTPTEGAESVRVHDSSGSVDVRIRPLIIVDQTVD
jgi:hypothetical protein